MGQMSDTQHTLDDIRRNAIIAEVYRCLAAGEQPAKEICEEYRQLTERLKEDVEYDS